VQFAKLRFWHSTDDYFSNIARGVDYPDVTHVIQYGPAENRETYIHRLGRTARAGKKGIGILVLGGRGEERSVIGRELKGLDVKVRMMWICVWQSATFIQLMHMLCLQRNKRYQDLIMGETIAKEDDAGGGINGHLNRKRINEKRLLKIHASVRSNNESTLRKHASDVYRSMLGYYANKMRSIGMNYKVEVVEYVNALALQMGFQHDNMPLVSLRTVQNIGLEGIRGLNVGNEDLGNDEGYDDNVAKRRASKKPRVRIR
jgi:ATP-dependent RNA helicase MSS116